MMGMTNMMGMNTVGGMGGGMGGVGGSMGGSMGNMGAVPSLLPQPTLSQGSTSTNNNTSKEDPFAFLD